MCVCISDNLGRQTPLTTGAKVNLFPDQDDKHYVSLWGSGGHIRQLTLLNKISESPKFGVLCFPANSLHVQCLRALSPSPTGDVGGGRKGWGNVAHTAGYTVRGQVLCL